MLVSMQKNSLKVMEREAPGRARWMELDHLGDTEGLQNHLGVIWKEGTSTEEFPESDCPLRQSAGHLRGD